jgi:glutamyl-tRNA synthetase
MDGKAEKVVVRFAPSPTGSLHVGSARTALFNWLYTRKMGGKAILRLEDTDKARSKPEYEQNIHEGLAWLGLNFNEHYKQSERGEVYKKYIGKMIDSGAAYVSKEKAKDDASRNVEVVRLKNPNTVITFSDKVRGDITFDMTELGHFVIARSVLEPLYHLAVVVDDHEMGITHVIRGEDHISNTPRQILIQQAIGAPRPIYCHIPLILAPDRSKLSKRHGAVAVTEYRDMGVLPQALNNYLALLGWSSGDDREIFSLDELVREFSLDNIQKSGAVFNMEKLAWVNREYIAHMPSTNFIAEAETRLPEHIKRSPHYSREVLARAEGVLRERTAIFSDITKSAEAGELNWLFSEPQYEPAKLAWRDQPDLNIIRQNLEKIAQLLDDVKDSEFNAESIKAAVWDYATVQGRGAVLWPMRYALTGLDKSPDPFEVGEIVGKVVTLRRLKAAIEKI